LTRCRQGIWFSGTTTLSRYSTVTVTGAVIVAEPLVPVIVTVYGPTVVPVFEMAIFAAPPHPIVAVATARNRSSPNIVCHFLRRNGNPKKTITAKVPLPPTAKIRRNELCIAAVDVPVVLMVTVAVTGDVPEMAAG